MCRVASQRCTYKKMHRWLEATVWGVVHACNHKLCVSFAVSRGSVPNSDVPLHNRLKKPVYRRNVATGMQKLIKLGCVTCLALHDNITCMTLYDVA